MLLTSVAVCCPLNLVVPRRLRDSKVVCHSSLCPRMQPGRSLRCCKEFTDSVVHSQFALLCLELSQLIADRIEEAARPLREEVATLKLLLAGVDGPPKEARGSDGLGLAHGEALFPLDSVEQRSSVVEETLHFGCFSPRGSPCPSPQLVATSATLSENNGEILAPKLQESCGDSAFVLPTELTSV